MKSILKRVQAYVSGSPLVHIAIAAFIGAALPVLTPAILHGVLTFAVVKIATSAGVAAVLRALILLVPSKKAAV